MAGQSCHGTPISQATGAKKNPKIWPSEPGTQVHVSKSVRPEQQGVEQGDEGRKLMSMMATFMASLPPSMVPRAMEPMKFSSLCNSSRGMMTWPSVAGFPVSGTRHLGEQDGSWRGHDDGAASRWRASTPIGNVGRHDAPRHGPYRWSMNGHQLAARALERNGRMVSGASVWPMKTDAATFRLSAPEMRMVLSMTQAKPRMMICITPM